MSKIVEDMMRDVVKDKARLMLKDGKLTIKEIPIYFIPFYICVSYLDITVRM